MATIRKISLTDFMNSKYRAYWEYSNRNGKNSIEPREQIPEVVRKIIFACYKIGIREREEHKTTDLIGETTKYHPHGQSSIEDSIKGVATAYKSQPATRILEGIGNFGSAPGDEGAAGRYTNIGGTPLLAAIFRDIPFVPVSADDTGLDQPEYISSPLPMALINGQSAIGTGKSCYIAERNALEVVHWIERMYRENLWDAALPAPAATSVTGCNTWFDQNNGYWYYQAVVHLAVDMNDLNKKGKFDVITNLPPKSTPAAVMLKLIQKLPTRASKQVVDGSGKGRPTYIVLPHGYLEEADYAKYGLRSARKEQVYIWDEKANTMRLADLAEVAKMWFEDRCNVVTRRLRKQLADSQSVVHRVDLIKTFEEKGMGTWKSEKIQEWFSKQFPETGEADTALVLNTNRRAFLPENLAKNEILRNKELNSQKIINERLEHVGDVVIEEAYEIINAQEAFFNR